MIKRETAAKIWNAYREIETAEGLLKELEGIQADNDYNKSAPSLKGAFGRKEHFEFGIPSGDNGHRLYSVSPELSLTVIRAHIANKRYELAEANVQARIELEGD